MQLLLDTCTFLWLAAEPDKLGARARTALDDPANDLVLSDVSVLEICLKWTAQKLELPLPPRTWVEQQRASWGLARLRIEAEHLYRTTELPGHHRDPFDRMLVAQAMTGDLVLVTPDPAITAYPVAAIW